MKVKTGEIVIPERFRMEYGDLKDLAESIDKVGLLHPIVVNKKEDVITLAAGCRRLLACMQLGLEEIEVNLYENLSELERREIELEENIKRKQFTWAEEVRAKAELVEIRSAQATPGLWGKPQVGKEVAGELGISEAGLSQDLDLAHAMKKFPDLAKEETKSGAVRKLRQMRDKVALEFLAKEAHQDEEMVQVYNMDCLEVLRAMPSESVDLVITDPPWGVNIDERGEFKYEESFEDGFYKSLALLEEVAKELARVTKDRTHLYFFFATKYYSETKQVLEKFLVVDPIPLIWWKKQGLNILPDKRFTYDYETIFFCYKKEKRDLMKPSRAVFEVSVPSGKIHPTQKPVELLERLVEISSVKGEVVLDPFAGSGSTVKAAVNLGRRAIGVELNTHFFNHMKCWVATKEETNDASGTS
jgi:site-specific DNA-methyltransferase (adenine-specific)